MAMISGGLFGLLGFIGVTILLHRRLTDPRIRINSRTSDIMLLVLLWLQFALGLATIPLSAQHLDGSLMIKLGEWAQRIVTFRPGAAEMLVDAGWMFKAHMFLGMTLFLVFPFTRLVHVWSGFATLGYLVRPYQVVRTRRTIAPSRAAVAPAARDPAGRGRHARARKGHVMSEMTGCGGGACTCGGGAHAIDGRASPPSRRRRPPGSMALPCIRPGNGPTKPACASWPGPNCCGRKPCARACCPRQPALRGTAAARPATGK